MPNDTVFVLVLLPFLAAAIERTVEIVMGPLGSFIDDWKKAKPEDQRVAWKRFLGFAIALILAALLAFGLDLDFVRPLLGESGLTTDEAKCLTAIALAGGSAPAHELIRLAEEAKKKAKLPQPPSG